MRPEMRIRKLVTTISLLIVVFFVAVNAKADTGEKELPKFSLTPLRVSGVVIPGYTATYGIGLSWNPEFNFATHWTAGLSLGIIPFSHFTPNNPVGMDYQLTLGRMICGDIWFEVAGGVQDWLNGGPSAALASGTFYFRFPDLNLGILDRAFMTYSAFLQSNNYVSEFRFGFGLGF